MRQEASTGEIAAVLVHFNIIMVEDVVIKADEKPLLIFAEGFPVVAIAEIGIGEGDDPFEAIAGRTAEEQEGVEVLIFLQLSEGGFDIFQMVEVEANIA